MSIKVGGSPAEKGKSGGAPAARTAPARHTGGATVDRVGATGRVSFAEAIDDADSIRIIADLDEVGAQLTRFPTTELMRRYRELVRMALDKVRGGMHIKREFKWRRTERSMFITIEKTEALTDELETALLREGDRARGLILADEIKGCLISLLF